METRLESTADPDGWNGCPRSIPSLLSIHSIHSIPTQQPMRIHLGSISMVMLTTAAFISRPHQAGSSNPPNDLVETTTPGHLPPSALSGHVETTSPGHPHTPELAKALTHSSHFSHGPIEVVLRLDLKEELSPSNRAAATRWVITRRPLHAQSILTQS